MGEEVDETVHSVELTPGREGVGGTIREIKGEEVRLGHQGIVSPLEGWGAQPTPKFLPGNSYGQRSLAGKSLWVAKSWMQLRN